MPIGFKRIDSNELDEFDMNVVDTAMDMPCSSFFYTVDTIVKKFDIPKEHIHIVEDAVRESVAAIWDIAYDIAKECSDEAASLFTSALMVNMVLELVSQTMKSQLLTEADSILEGDVE